MSRIAALAALTLLTGCYDFEGDLGRLGFVSNLQLHPGQKWTPDSPIASGFPAELAASEVIGRDGDEAPDVEATVRGRGVTTTPTEHGIAITASGRARATVAWSGEVDDRFSVELAPAHEAALVDPIALLDGWEVPEADLAVAPGQIVALWPVLTDSRGRVLGYDPERLEIDPEGQLSAWMDEGELKVEAAGDGSVAIAYAGPLAEVALPVARCDEVERLEIAPVRIAQDDGVLVGALAVAWLDDDTRLLGCPVDWSWTDGLSRDDEERPDVLILTGQPKGAVAVEARMGGLVGRAHID